MSTSAERMRRKRERDAKLKTSLIVTQISPDVTPAPATVVTPKDGSQPQLTNTDKLFDADQPGYYIFDKRTFQRQCFYCGRSFSTSLELNKFCSPEHKRSYLNEALQHRFKHALPIQTVAVPPPP